MSKPAEKTITELKAEWNAAWEAHKTAHEAWKAAWEAEKAAAKKWDAAHASLAAAYEAYWSKKLRLKLTGVRK